MFKEVRYRVTSEIARATGDILEREYSDASSSGIGAILSNEDAALESAQAKMGQEENFSSDCGIWTQDGSGVRCCKKFLITIVKCPNHNSIESFPKPKADASGEIPLKVGRGSPEKAETFNIQHWKNALTKHERS